MVVSTRVLCATCIFVDELAKKNNLVGKKRKTEAGIEPSSTGMIESVTFPNKNCALSSESQL